MISSGVAGCCAVQRPPLPAPAGCSRPCSSHEPPTRRVHRQDSVGEQPQDELPASCARPGCPVPTASAKTATPPAGGRLDRQPGLPPPPCRPRRPRRARWDGQGGQDLRQLPLQPGVEHRIGTGGQRRSSIRTRPSAGCGTASAPWPSRCGYILVWLAGGDRPPASPGLPGMRGTVWNGPAWSQHPDRQAQRLAQTVGVLNQFFWARRPGPGEIVTVPALRRRSRRPGSGTRCGSRWWLYPASCGTRHRVKVETRGRPSGAERSTRRRVERDQVAVPSRSGVGVRTTLLCRMRSRSAAS